MPIAVEDMTPSSRRADDGAGGHMKRGVACSAAAGRAQTFRCHVAAAEVEPDLGRVGGGSAMGRMVGLAGAIH